MDLLKNFDFLVVVRYFVLTFLGIYIVFAIVIVRQVQLMIDTLDVGFELPIRIISFVHLVVAIIVMVFVIGAL